MILLFTDFGNAGPYETQMRAAIRHYSNAEVVSLFADLPAHDPRAAACLLAAYMPDFAVDSVFLCVIDPDVGSGEMRPVFLRVANRWFVGPNNGVFDSLLLQYPHHEMNEIDWQPQYLSASFHGRDLFAPVAGMLAEGELPLHRPICYTPSGRVSADLAEIIYCDHFGNMMTGLRAVSFPELKAINVAGKEFIFKRTFSDVAVGASICYANANGLLEIAVNRGRACELHGLRIGQAVEVIV